MIKLRNLSFWYDLKENIERKPSDEVFEVSNERAKELLEYEGSYPLVEEVKATTKKAATKKVATKKAAETKEEAPEEEVEVKEEVTKVGE
ncbi:hypothetical protein [Macrococcus capreoli]|uniref:hypothetical protein n=1 Tax=Macrococcus capreoli TaxID=2982690 RepID=UPI0021D5E0E3|nr:hypothetical protein [Macrococcus sp. TMW 2.2395]MCU7557260.1 hypothetical protein [Macrococcus sp. TMW 2.2395]